MARDSCVIHLVLIPTGKLSFVKMIQEQITTTGVHSSLNP